VDKMKKKQVRKSIGIDPCKEAKETLKRFNADTKAGHKGADEYWLGQSTAYGTMCTQKGLKNKTKTKGRKTRK
jgi:hypothetical protein